MRAVPPNELDAEAAVLSAVLLDPTRLPSVRHILAPEHLYSDANRHIFKGILALADTGREVDVVTLAALLREQDRLAQVGGTPYLAQLADATPAVAHVEDHAALVVEAWRKRRIQNAAREATAEAANGSSATSILAALRSALDRVDVPPNAGPSALPFKWVGDFGELHKPEPLRWLLRDRRTGKPFMRAGECAVLAGDGGVGKGFFWLQMSVSVALGRDLFGALTPEQSGRVALLVAEDKQTEVHHRLHRIANALALDPEDVARLCERVGVMPLSGQQVNLLAVDPVVTVQGWA